LNKPSLKTRDLSNSTNSSLPAKNPKLGKEKKSDLEFFFVYKYQILDVQYLLAYLIDEKTKEIVLMAVGPHENFYRDLKR